MTASIPVASPSDDRRCRKVVDTTQRAGTHRRRIEDDHVGRMPGPQAPRSVIPKRSAGREVSMRTASSRCRVPRLTHPVTEQVVGKQASQSWLACAPASERPSTVCGSVSRSRLRSSKFTTPCGSGPGDRSRGRGKRRGRSRPRRVRAPSVIVRSSSLRARPATARDPDARPTWTNGPDSSSRDANVSFSAAARAGSR